jgi:dihydroorotase-like cyclic amidohydrolase
MKKKEKEFISGQRVIAETNEGKIIEGTLGTEKAKIVRIGERKFPEKEGQTIIIENTGKKYTFGDLKGQIKEIKSL